MSHFSVLIIGDDIRQQLAPYHEFECTGVDDQYVQDIDQTQEVIDYMKSEACSPQDALEYFDIYGKAVSDESEVDREGEHKYGFAVIKDSKLVKVVRRTNPNKKWDWWEVGGRWEGYLLGGDGERVNQLTRSQLDMSAMRKEAEDAARNRWREARAVLGGEAFRPWKYYWKLARSLDTNIRVARQEYLEQEVLMRWRQSDIGRNTFGGPDEFLVSEDAYVRQVVSDTLLAFAVVKDGQWYERGQMGFVGCVSDEKDFVVWEREVNSLLDGLPGDTLLTIVDCHI